MQTHTETPKKSARTRVTHVKGQAPIGAKKRPAASVEPVAAVPGPSKPEIVIALMSRPEGATLAQMMDATGWQVHSVRSLISAGMRRKGIVPTQTMEGDPPVRVYRIVTADCV